MNTIFFTFLAIFYVATTISAELKINTYGKEDIFAYNVSESIKFFIWSSDAVWTTDIDVTGSNTGRGS